MPKTFVILFDQEDAHSLTLASALHEVDKSFEIFVKDPDGRSYFCDDGVRLLESGQRTTDLVARLENRIPNGQMEGFDFHLSLFQWLHANGVIVHPFGGVAFRPGTYTGVDFGLEYLDKSNYVGVAYTKFHADVLANLIGRQQLETHLWSQTKEEDPDVCFAMPPCGFNRLPSYILDFSHKLQINKVQDGFDYIRLDNSEEMEDDEDNTWSRRPAKELAPKKDVLRALVDIALCRIIYEKNYRFFGTCHGAQAMWLAMGQRVTRQSRYGLSDSIEEDNVNMVVGLGQGGKAQISRGGVTTLLTKGDHMTALPQDAGPDFAYSTDFNHEHFMRQPDGTSALNSQWIVRHPLSELIDTQEYTNLLKQKKHSLATRKLLKKRGEFVQSYAVGRIFCFQDHPHYHVTPQSVSQGRIEGKNKYFKESREILKTTIWQ